MSSYATSDAEQLFSKRMELGGNLASSDDLWAALPKTPIVPLEGGTMGAITTEKSEQQRLYDMRRDLMRESPHDVFQTSIYNKNVYTSFSGADTSVSVVFPGGEPVAVGECQTITYSIFRPMTPVFNLGSSRPNGFVRGQRTIAGSIIFTVFDRHVLLSAFHKSYRKFNAPCLNKEMLADDLPSFDFQVTFMNEYGQSALLIIHDVRLTSEGQVMSIEDLVTENTMQYVASDITLMRPNLYEDN